MKPGSDIAVPGQEEIAAASSAAKRVMRPSDYTAGDAAGRKRRKGSGARRCGDTPEGASEIGRLYDADRDLRRKKTVVCGAALAVLCLFSLCLSPSRFCTLYSPVDVLGSYFTWFQLNVLSIFDPSILLRRTELLAAYPMYYEATARFVYTVITALCGVLLAVAGMLYQNAFKNPIAAPTMLGVTGGISFGCMLMVVVYGAEAASMAYYDMRFVFAFICGMAVLVLVLGIGSLLAPGRAFNILDVMLTATILTGVLNAIVNNVVNGAFSTQDWTAYYEISNVTDMTFSPTSLAILIAGSLVCLVPVFRYRFQLNAIAFSDTDMRMMGVNTVKLRLVALVCGSLMVVLAQTFVGGVAMVSLVVPFISRAVFGAEFRNQALGNVLIGAGVLVLCRIFIAFIPFVGDGVPLGSMVSLVTLPLFAWVMVAVQRQWNDR